MSGGTDDENSSVPSSPEGSGPVSGPGRGEGEEEGEEEWEQVGPKNKSTITRQVSCLGSSVWHTIIADTLGIMYLCSSNTSLWLLL